MGVLKGPEGYRLPPAGAPGGGAAAVPGGTGRRPDVIERTLARTAQTDIPAALATARDELMPYLRPGGGAPKPRPEAYAHADIPPELLQPWRLPNRWMEQPEPEPGEPGPIDLGPELPEPPPPAACSGSGARTTVDSVAAFQQALNTAGPDDTIILAPGSYGGLNISKGGTATAPIYIAAAYPAVSGGAVPQSTPKSSITSIAVNAGNLVICGLHLNAGAFTSARHGSLTKAAAELGVTPGALSHQIRALEEFLGMELFHRLPRAITLTDAAYSGANLNRPGMQALMQHIETGAIKVVLIFKLERVLRNFAAVAPISWVQAQVFPALFHEIFNEPERAEDDPGPQQEERAVQVLTGIDREAADLLALVLRPLEADQRDRREHQAQDEADVRRRPPRQLPQLPAGELEHVPHAASAASTIDTNTSSSVGASGATSSTATPAATSAGTSAAATTPVTWARPGSTSRPAPPSSPTIASARSSGRARSRTRSRPATGVLT